MVNVYKIFLLRNLYISVLSNLFTALKSSTHPYLDCSKKEMKKIIALF
jgi:hypothetical protein